MKDVKILDIYIKKEFTETKELLDGIILKINDLGFSGEVYWNHEYFYGYTVIRADKINEANIDLLKRELYIKTIEERVEKKYSGPSDFFEVKEGEGEDDHCFRADLVAAKRLREIADYLEGRGKLGGRFILDFEMPKEGESTDLVEKYSILLAYPLPG